MGIVFEIESRKNLEFSSTSLVGKRINERFTSEAATKEIEEATTRVLKICSTILPSEYYPKSLRIILESNAKVKLNQDPVEDLPISMVLSMQVPRSSEIRMGMWEISHNIPAYESVLAHEMGHMLIEWPCLKAGIVSKDDRILTHWDRSIYEGVADFFAAGVTGKTTIVDENIWFHRSLFDYQSLEDATYPKNNLYTQIRDGLEHIHLVPKYKAYRDWVDEIKVWLEDMKRDPYSQGTWIAQQLWQLSDSGKKFQETMKQLIKLATSGRQLKSADDLLSRMTSSHTSE